MKNFKLIFRKLQSVFYFTFQIYLYGLAGLSQREIIPDATKLMHIKMEQTWNVTFLASTNMTKGLNKLSWEFIL